MLELRGSDNRGQGFGGMYRGFKVTMIRDVPYTALQFVLFENIRQWCMRQSPDGERRRSEMVVGRLFAGCCVEEQERSLRALLLLIQMLQVMLEMMEAMVMVLLMTGSVTFLESLGVGIVSAIFASTFTIPLDVLK